MKFKKGDIVIRTREHFSNKGFPEMVYGARFTVNGYAHGSLILDESKGSWGDEFFEIERSPIVTKLLEVFNVDN